MNNIILTNYNFKIILLLIISLLTDEAFGKEKVILLKENFNKVIVSPHIETIFVKGDVASITIKNINVPVEKFQYEIISNTLQVYLKGAKTITKNKKNEYKNFTIKKPIYKSTVARIIITYVNVDTFSLRGEEKINFLNDVNQPQCKLRVYGESEVIIDTINVGDLRIIIYGDSYLSIKEGIVERQKITAYGSTKIITNNIKCKEVKLTAYGDGNYQFNVSNKIKITSYGESTITYKGSAKLKKGIIIGDTKIIRVN